MTMPIDHTRLHRTAKYFMDNGRAGTHEEAMALLQRFGLAVHVGPEIATSALHQTALLTLVNLTRRTLLGGVEIVGLPDDTACLSPLSKHPRLADAVLELGGRFVPAARPGWPHAVIGTVPPPPRPAWCLTWEGWRGGVLPAYQPNRLNEGEAIELAPVLAAAICAAEAFAFHAGDHIFPASPTYGI